MVTIPSFKDSDNLPIMGSRRQRTTPEPPVSKKAKFTPITAGGRRAPIQLKEKLPYRYLGYLIKNFDKYAELLCPNGKDKAAMLKTMTAYYHGTTKKKNDNGIGTINVEYHSRTDLGRVYAKGGLSFQSFCKVLRHTLARKLYLDLDIKNSMPTIIMQYAEKHGIDTPTLKRYVTERQTMLEELCEKTGLTIEQGKDTVCAIMNDGNGHLTRQMDPPDWITDLYQEMKMLYVFIETNEPEVWELALKRAEEKKAEGKPGNPQGSAMSILYGELEHRCIMVILEKLKEWKYVKDVVVLVFDGIMIPIPTKKGFDLTKLLEDLEAAVLHKTGYNIKLHKKDMDKGIELPPEEELGDTEISRITEADERIIKNDDEGAFLYLEHIINDVRMCNGAVYARIDGVWRPHEKVVDNYLLRRCMEEMNLCKLGGAKGDQVKPYSKQLYGAKNIIQATKAKIPETPDFNEQVWQASMGKMFFNDGWLDFASLLEYKRQGMPCAEAAQRAFTEGFEGTDSMIKIKYDFPERNEEDIKEFWDKILIPIFTKDNEELTVWLHATARAMAGHVKDKRWLVMLGERNSGKGVLQSVKMATFGPYVGFFNLGSVKRIKSRDGGDEAKKNSWLIPFEFKRFAESNEGGKDELDGEKLKGQMGSGGDVMQGRQNYMDAREFRLQSTFTISCNDFPNVNPSDALQTVLAFTMPRVFVPAEVYDANIIRDGFGPGRDTNDNDTHRADNNIKDYCSEPRAAAAFLHILLEYYRPIPAQPCASMREFRDGLEAGGEDDIVDSLFEFTGNMNDMVLIKDVKDLLAKYDTLQYAKLRRIAGKRNKGMKLPTNPKDKRMIDGKRGNVMYGIKILESALNPTHGHESKRQWDNFDLYA